MTKREQLLYELTDTPVSLIQAEISPSAYVALDLSVQNKELAGYDVSIPEECQAYITGILRKTGTQIAYGGYLEERNLYKKSANFMATGTEERNIHLGLDIWAPAGTKILVPYEGLVHSFADNGDPANYGPTIILKHQTEKLKFYTLYGHLSRESLEKLTNDLPVSKGQKLATLGSVEENGGYAPHLHFQIIFDLEGNRGDYPGVCSTSTLEFYKNNCPDPSILLKF